ncbi:hypothetical protein BDV12DRAFT_2717 [Aspergillus spectabilis]
MYARVKHDHLRLSWKRSTDAEMAQASNTHPGACRQSIPPKLSALNTEKEDSKSVSVCCSRLKISGVSFARACIVFCKDSAGLFYLHPRMRHKGHEKQILSSSRRVADAFSRQCINFPTRHLSPIIAWLELKENGVQRVGLRLKIFTFSISFDKERSLLPIPQVLCQGTRRRRGSGLWSPRNAAQSKCASFESQSTHSQKRVLVGYSQSLIGDLMWLFMIPPRSRLHLEVWYGGASEKNLRGHHYHK